MKLRNVILYVCIFLAATAVSAFYYWNTQETVVVEDEITELGGSSSRSPVPTPRLTSPAPALITPRPTVVSPKPTPIASPVISAQNTVSLAVPFTIQAPDGQWVEPWKEGCEEAALLMADAFNDGNREATLPVAQAKADIQKMVDWQIDRFGRHKDIGVDEMAIVAKEYLGYKNVIIKKNSTLNDIKRELSTGRPVIVSAAGRLLKNPYFTPPGPVYHVFLIKGYENGELIVNENGTRQGNGYRYSESVLESALHDYGEGTDITTNPPAYLVLVD